MAQESYPADDKYWNGKKLALTDNTKKNMLKKANTLDAEMYVQSHGYSLTGDEALQALEESGLDMNQLISQSGTYSNLIYSAIEALERNSSADDRIKAMQAISSIGYTNLFEETTGDFILPPKEAGTLEEPVTQPKKKQPEDKPVYYNPYYRASNNAPSRPAPQQRQEIVEEQPQEYQQPSEPPHPPERNASAFIASLMPNRSSQVVSNNEVKSLGRGSSSNPNIRPVGVKPAAELGFSRNRTPVQSTQPNQQQKRPMMNTGVLNPDMARRLGGRPMAPTVRVGIPQRGPAVPATGRPIVQRVAPRPMAPNPRMVYKPVGTSNTTIGKLGIKKKK